MNFVLDKQLTNARPPKADVAELITTPTSGNMRLTEKAANRLGVVSGDYLGLVAARVDGQPHIFIHKGWKGGEGESNVGSKLASPTDKLAGGTLLFSSALAYQTLGGSATTNKHFTVAEEPIEKDGVAYYEITLANEVAVTPRKKAESVEVES